MIKRLLGFTLLLFLSFLFASCSNPKNDNEIVIWHNMRPEETAVFQKQLNEFMKLNPGIKVTQLYKETEEMRSSYIIAAIAGQGPDLIYGPSDQVGPFAEMNIIKPLDTIFTKGYLSHFNEKALIRLHGHLWQIADKLGNHLTLVYNKDMVPVPPKTDKELIKIAQKLTKDTNGDGTIDQYGLVWNYTEPYFFIPFLTGFGGWVLDSTNTPTLDTPAMINALKFIQDLRDKYKIIPKEADYDIADVMFKERKAAMIINGDWSWSSYGNAGINYGISILPLITETGKYCTPMVAPKGFSINENVNPEKLRIIKELMKFLLSPDKELETSLEVKTFPSRKELYTNPKLLHDEIFVNSKKQIEHGIALPIVTEMRAIWDAMRPAYQAVLGGATTPEAAAKQMQKSALQKIDELRENYNDPTGRAIVYILLMLAVVFVFYFTRRSIKSFFINFGKNKFAYYLLIPAILVMIAVVLYPFLYNIILSFSNMSLAHIKDWSIVGFIQYAKVFTEPQFYVYFLKTIIWTGTNIVFHVTLGVTLALLINRKLPGSGIFRTLLILPWAIPQYIVALTWRGMFNYEYGAINLILVKYLSISPIAWLKSPFEAFAAVIITNIWLGFPFMMIIALGALQSIPHELYEAADIDGAKWFHKLKNITIPLIKPVMIPAITLGVIWTFNNINVVWLVSNAGEPSDKTHILVSFVYKAAFNLYRYGYAAAFSMIIFLILFGFGMTFLRRTRATETVY
jgi:arabinogalactan oligomer / maltooligosaccharide transport system substrate-binding protein/arabinogalactan oligomer / maltooligosaccharide transport system permease protein